MRKDGLHTTSQLTNNLLHPFTSLSKRSAMNVGLGRYTAHIQAGTTHMTILKDNHLQALTGRIFRRTIATRTCANNC